MKFQHDIILNRDGDDFILLTNNLTNAKGDSAYIEYVIDQTTFALFSPEFEECIAVLLAAELCPMLGRSLEVRREFLAEYENITIPKCKRDIQSQADKTSVMLPDYSGGRSSRNQFHGHRWISSNVRCHRRCVRYGFMAL